MEDSNAMTIEFLRARLLSERSVSRSAKQRADELAKRLEELEEQLNIVSLQRKLAEKATTEVLAILEGQGISEDEFDFNSDQDVPYESGVGDISTKGGQPSNSNIGRSISCEPSGCEHESTPKTGRSLSWKGRDVSPSSLDKYRSSNIRRHGSWTNFLSASKHRGGKSCRQIRQKETRSVVDECSNGCASVEPQQNQIEEVRNSFLGGTGIFRKKSHVEEEKVVSEVISSNNINYSDGCAKDMEKALEHQAQLIGQYEAMEKAQREWEEKFIEHNSSTPDSCDPGNHSDITEERDDVKAQVPLSDKEVQVADSRDKGVSLSKEVLEITHHGSMPISDADKEELNDYKNAFASDSGALSQHFPVPSTKGNECPDGAENFHHQLPGDCQQQSHCSPQYQSGQLPQSSSNHFVGNNQEIVPHEKPHELHSVLNLLKQAKLALQQRISALPLTEYGHSEKSVEPSLTLAKTKEKFEIPVGFSGLFKLPTEVSEPASGSNFRLSSPSRFITENSYYEEGITWASSDKYAPSPYLGTGMNTFSDDLSITRRYREAGPSLNVQRPRLDPYVNKDTFLSPTYTVPSFPIHPSYQYLMQQKSTSRTSPSLGGGVPPSGPFN